MSGFDAARWMPRSGSARGSAPNFVCAIDKGDPSKVFPRSPRLDFDEARAFA